MQRVIKAIVFATLTALAAVVGAGFVSNLAPAGTDGWATGATTAVFGMLLGLFYAWTRAIPWLRVRYALMVWKSQLANQLGWATVGCMSLAVLVFY